ncbi:MAG: ribonuclease H family protein [Petrimonas sp.]|nr:ribonuclease H family protein [Petrimonas sp.]
MKKQKFYVVWQGVEPGVYTSWDDCKAQVSGFEGARYKSFDSMAEAQQAFTENPWKHIGPQKKKAPPSLDFPAEIVRESLAVDAACSGNPGRMEYRGVWVSDGLEMFRVGPYEGGTNNIGEFLAIVHALALLNNDDRNFPIYSDSVNAIKWIEKKKCNTKLEPSDKNKPVFDLIARAEKWLQTHTWKNKILKWQTESWGEIPADFGRK